MQIFTTPRLTVGDWTPDDAPAALGIYGEPEVTRWLGEPPMRPAESVPEMSGRLAKMIARNAQRPGFGLWPVRRSADGALIGAVLLVPVARSESAAEPSAAEEIEIGWHFNPRYWGSGYATEAAAGLVSLAFGDRGLDRVIAVVRPGNLRSMALCQRLGMTSHGLTSAYYGVALELFSLPREAA